MRKLFVTLLLAVIVIAGCQSSSNDENEKEVNENEQVVDNTQAPKVDKEEIPEKEALTLHVLASDEKAGVTIESSDFYSGIQKMIDKDPTVGVEDDFTVRTMDIITTKDGDSMLVMLGINRINVPLQNFSFDLTIGNKQGEDVREKVSGGHV